MKLQVFTAIALSSLALVPIARAESISGEPDAYLDYIEATGTQYIDTGVNAETGLKARIDFAPGAKVESNDDWAFLCAVEGTGVSDTRSRIMLCHLHNQKPFFGYGLKSRGNPENSFDFVRGERYEIVTDITDSSALEVYQNGKKTFGLREPTSTSHLEYSSIGNVNLNLNLYLFAGNNSGEANWYARGKLYECKIFKKNAESGELELIRHYLPCMKGGRAGLYDKVNRTISFSYGTGEFAEGPVLDRPLALVESLTSDGAGDQYQCFNTWVWGKSGLKSEVEVSLFSPSSDRGILACRETSGDTRFFMAYTYQSAFRFATGELKGKSDLNVVATATGRRYVIKTDTTPGAPSMTVSTDGGPAEEVLKDDVDYGSTYMATAATLSLLATHRGYDKNYASPVEATLYAAKIWDGGEILRDFVPVVATNSSGALYAGLYDKVTERIYRPLKGKLSDETELPFDLSLEVGAVTNVLADVPAPKKRVEYVESDGVADFVDLGVAARDGLEMDAQMEWLTVPADGAFVGARTDLQTNNDNGNAGVRFFPYHHWVKDISGHRFGYDGQIRGNEETAVAGTQYRISSHLDCKANGGQRFSVSSYVNGGWTAPNVVETTYSGPVDTGLQLFLFAVNLDGKPRYFGHSRVYSLKLRMKGQDGAYAPTRDFIPVRDPLTGGIALWDKVSGQYFRNAARLRLSGGGEERDIVLPFVMTVR